MIDSQSQAILEDILRRESRSLLSYMHDAYPWTTVSGGRKLVQLREIVKAEGEAVGDLGTYLTRNRIRLPYFGSYPMSFTSLNFISLDYLLPRLIKSEQELIAALESGVAGLPEGEAKELARKLLGIKRTNLETLKGLAVPAAA